MWIGSAAGYANVFQWLSRFFLSIFWTSIMPHWQRQTKLHKNCVSSIFSVRNIGVNLKHFHCCSLDWKTINVYTVLIGSVTCKFYEFVFPIWLIMDIVWWLWAMESTIYTHLSVTRRMYTQLPDTFRYSLVMEHGTVIHRRDICLSVFYRGVGHFGHGQLGHGYFGITLSNLT